MLWFSLKVLNYCIPSSLQPPAEFKAYLEAAQPACHFITGLFPSDTALWALDNPVKAGTLSVWLTTVPWLCIITQCLGRMNESMRYRPVSLCSPFGRENMHIFVLFYLFRLFETGSGNLGWPPV